MRWRPFSDVSMAVTRNHVDINSVWKSLDTSCVCVCVAEVQTRVFNTFVAVCVASCVCGADARAHVFNAFISSAKAFISSSNSFVSSAKSVRPQHKMRSSLAINMFVCSAIRIWRYVAKTLAIASDKHVRLLCGIIFEGE